MATRYKDKHGRAVKIDNSPKQVYKKDHKWNIPDVNKGKDITDFYKIISKKADLMKRQYKLGQRKKIKGIQDVIYKDDWQQETLRDVKLGKTLSSALDKEQDLGNKLKKGLLGKAGLRTKKKDPVGPNVRDVVKLLSEQKADRHEFKTMHGDYDKAAEQEVSKNKRIYKNNTYEEGK